MDQFFQAWAVQIVIPIIRGEAIQQMVEVLGANLTVGPSGDESRGAHLTVGPNGDLLAEWGVSWDS